mmetsp:Transcript_21196/g.68645  ORF Transcript_21196/g.68645 Transcript_21196/m.68645 type:complete len:270 (+) Transcript_21196:3551-4360(+)
MPRPRHSQHVGLLDRSKRSQDSIALGLEQIRVGKAEEVTQEREPFLELKDCLEPAELDGNLGEQADVRPRAPHKRVLVQRPNERGWCAPQRPPQRPHRVLNLEVRRRKRVAVERSLFHEQTTEPPLVAEHPHEIEPRLERSLEPRERTLHVRQTHRSSPHSREARTDTAAAAVLPLCLRELIRRYAHVFQGADARLESSLFREPRHSLRQRSHLVAVRLGVHRRVCRLPHLEPELLKHEVGRCGGVPHRVALFALLIRALAPRPLRRVR